MVVLIRWYAAADGALIYLCSADDKDGRQCIFAPPAILFLSLMPPRKGQPFPPERRNCSHTFRGVLQFRLPSAPQRYNTLDFPTENRVPTGMLLAPIGNPEPRGYSPLDTLLFLAAMVSTLSKLGGFHAVKNVKSEKHFHHRVVVLRFSYMGYCLVFANSHVSAMAKAERTIFV